MRHVHFWALTALVVFSGCATGYQAQNWRGGFRETWQSDRSVTVRYDGNGNTSVEQAETYARLRASELAIERGFPYFRAEARTDVQTQRMGSILTGGARTTRKPNVELVAVMLSEDEGRALERQGVAVVQARRYIMDNGPADMRRRLLGD